MATTTIDILKVSRGHRNSHYHHITLTLNLKTKIRIRFFFRLGLIGEKNVGKIKVYI